jgi:hypothetical protein
VIRVLRRASDILLIYLVRQISIEGDGVAPEMERGLRNSSNSGSATMMIGPRCTDQANDDWRRVSPVAAHSGDRLLSEPAAGTQPWQREPLFMPKRIVPWSLSTIISPSWPGSIRPPTS